MSETAERSEMILALEPRPESARIVRRAMHAQGLSSDVAPTVDLLSTEIIGNAVRHADLCDGQRIVFFARICDDFARVEIADPGPGFDPEEVAVTGYGLRLLRALATRWGIECARGCRVWFEVDRRPRAVTGRFGRDAAGA